MKFFVLFLTLFACLIVKPQHYSELGSPFVQKYTPDDYNANNQNWSIVQDVRGYVFVANTNGLLQFDGTNWRLFQTATGSAVRVVSIGYDSVIYLGGNGDFGFVVADKNYSTKYISLLNKLPEKEREFSRVSAIYSVSYGVFFFLKDKIFVYRGDSISVKKFSSIPNYGIAIEDIIIVANSKDKSLYTIKNGEFVKISGSENFADKAGRIAMCRFGNQQDILIGTENKGFWILRLSEFYENDKKTFNFDKKNDKSLVPFEVADYDYIKANEFFTVEQIDINTYAIGTQYGGLILVDNKGKTKQVIKKTNGLTDNSITDIHVDHLGNLWVTHQKGISYIHYNTKLTIFSEAEGFEGSVYRVIRYKNKIFAATSNGLLYLTENSIFSKNVNSFRQIQKTRDKIWDLFIYKDKLFFAGQSIIGIIDDTTVVDTFPINCYSIYISDSIPNILWIGDQEGLLMLKFDWNKNKFIPKSKPIKVKGVLGPVRRFRYWNNRLWLSTSYEGVYSIEIEDIDNQKFKIIKYDKKNGLTTPNQNILALIDNQLIFCSEGGLFIPNKDKVEKLKLFKGPQTDTLSSIYLLKIKDKYYVMTNNFDFGNIEYDKNQKIHFFDNPIGSKIRKFRIYDLYADRDSLLWFCTNKGLLRYDIVSPQDYKKPFGVLLTKVVFDKDSVYFEGSFYDPQSLKDSVYTRFLRHQGQNDLKIPYKLNSVTFYFTSTQYENPENTLYSYFLEGFDKEWSAWTKNNFKEYSYLREGKYVFRVRAKNAFNTISEETTFSFIILPPWYRTIYAYIAYIIFGAAIIYLLLYLNSLRLKYENKRLEAIIQQRTAEIQEKNAILEQQKEEIQAQAETLLQLNEELEKLAIVARETDNSIIIMDANGKFLWANNAFSRVYGISFQEYLENYGYNIFEASNSKDIKEIVAKCITEKSSIVYEFQFQKPDGSKIWLQTTLTPILDHLGNINKLVAVETDITKIKEFEIELLQKNEEILTQKEEILTQKEELEKVNYALEEKNEYISAGIRYAKNIQSAVLPALESLPNFVESSVLYLPKDIVSGDFYWYGKVNTNNQDYHFFAMVDCTGHGVPGAFMSLIANSLLNEIILINKTLQTNEILNILHQKIIEILHQKHSGTNDGMDLILLKVQKQKNDYNIQYSGAKRNFLIYRNLSKSLELLKTDRFSIGGYIADIPRNHNAFNTTLVPNDILYLYSDGITDQVGEDNRKIGISNLTRQIHKSILLPIEEQLSLLEKFFVDWKKNELQRDDVTLWAIKFLVE